MVAVMVKEMKVVSRVKTTTLRTMYVTSTPTLPPHSIAQRLYNNYECFDVHRSIKPSPQSASNSDTGTMELLC
jgi:hypothetical protein